MPKVRVLKAPGAPVKATQGIDQSTGLPTRVSSVYTATPDTTFFNPANRGVGSQMFAGNVQSEESKAVSDPFSLKNPYMETKQKTGDFVRNIHNFYIDKAKSTTDQNEKLSAIASIKKMFPKSNIDPNSGELIREYNMPKVPGATTAFDALKVKYQVDPLEPDVVKKGEYESTSQKRAKQGVDPYVALNVLENPDSKRIFDNVVNTYKNDVLSKNDPNRISLLQEADRVGEEFTKTSAKYTIDQINVGKVFTKLDQNLGSTAGLYKQWFYEDKGNSGSGLAKGSVIDQTGYKNKLGLDPLVNDYADMYVDWATNASRTNFYSNGRQASSHLTDVADEFHEFAQEQLGLNWAQQMWYGQENTDDLIRMLDERGANGKEMFKNFVIDYWSKNGMDIYQGMDETMSTDRPDSFQTDYPFMAAPGASSYADIFTSAYKSKYGDQGLIMAMDNAQKVSKLPGYNSFYQEYSKASADDTNNLLSYNPKGLGEVTGEGQGAKFALPYTINYDASLPTTGELFLGDRPAQQDLSGNAFLPSVLNNFFDINSQTAASRDNLTFSDKPYLFDGDMNALLTELDITDSPTKNWDWDNTISTNLDDKHDEAINANSLDIIKAYLKDTNNYYGKQSEDARPKGEIKIFPLGASTDLFSGYQISINGKWLKSKGYQEDENDKTYSMLIPTGKTNNKAYNLIRKSDWVDMVIQADGGISYNLDGVGNFKIGTKTIKGKEYYTVNSSYYNLDATTGRLKQDNFRERIFEKGFYSGEMLYEQLKEKFLSTQYSNENTKMETKRNSTNLIFDPSQLLQTP